MYIDDIDKVVNIRRAELKNKVKAAMAAIKQNIDSTKREIQGNIRHVIMLISVISLIALARLDMSLC